MPDMVKMYSHVVQLYGDIKELRLWNGLLLLEGK